MPTSLRDAEGLLLVSFSFSFSFSFLLSPFSLLLSHCFFLFLLLFLLVSFSPSLLLPACSPYLFSLLDLPAPCSHSLLPSPCCFIFLHLFLLVSFFFSFSLFLSFSLSLSLFFPVYFSFSPPLSPSSLGLSLSSPFLVSSLSLLSLSLYPSLPLSLSLSSFFFLFFFPSPSSRLPPRHPHFRVLLLLSRCPIGSNPCNFPSLYCLWMQVPTMFVTMTSSSATTCLGIDATFAPAIRTITEKECFAKDRCTMTKMACARQSVV